MTTARTLCRRISGVALCLGLVVGVLGGAAAMFHRTGSAVAAASQPAALASLYADIDGDGLADAITIDVGFDAALPRTGLVTVNSGATGQALYTIAGETANDRFGYAAAVADLDGDGARELILSAPGAQAAGGSGAGRLYIYSASSGQLSRSISADVGLRIGLSVRTIADQDGDGWGELVVEGGRMEGLLWRASSLIYSGGNGRLLAARDATAGGISRYVEDGGRAYVAADLDDSGIVDVQDVTLMASGLAGAGGPELDVNRDGTVDSADLAAVAESLLRGDRSMVASGLVTEVAGEADAIAAGWAEAHPDTELSLSWSQITHNAQSDEGSGDNSMLGGGGGHGTGPPRTGRIPCDCPGIGPDTAGGPTAGCPSHVIGCPDRSVLVGGTVGLPQAGPNCEVTITGDPGIFEYTGEGNLIRFLVDGCIGVSVTCYNPDGTCCSCQGCRICAYYEPPCEAEVGFVNCPTVDDPPFPIDALNTLVFEAVGLPERDHVDGLLTLGVYDWAIQVSDCTSPCSWNCPDCPDGCLPNYNMTTLGGGIRLGDHPSFATLDLTGAQCLWVRVRYRFAEKEDCDPATCCEIPTQCCHAVATCKVALYDRDDDLDSDGDGYCDREEAQSDPDSGGRPIDRLIDRDLDGINRPRDVRGPTEYELLLPHDNPPWRALPYRERFDTDKDGLQDLAELRVGLSPELRFTTAGEPDRYTPAGLAADRDQDLVDDVFEMAAGLDTTVRDTDGDGIVDGIELRGGTDPAVSHRHESADTDGDGLSDYEEVRFYWTDRDHTDTDGDGLNDFFEVRAGLNPRSPYSDSRRVLVNGLGGSELRVELGLHDGVADSDFDGLNNALEQYWGTDPTYRDSDGDGVSDIEELLGGTSPTDPNDGGVPLPSDDLCFMLVSIGGRFNHPTLGCVENGGEGADPRPEGGGSGLGPGVGGMGDDKPTTDWTITIGGDLNGDGDLDDPGEQQFPQIQTGPGGTRTTVLLAFERGRCYTINLGGRRRPEYQNAHDSWWFQMIPVDPRVVVDGRPQICADCCCVTVDQSPGTGAIGNYCQRSVGSSTMTATVCLPVAAFGIDADNSAGLGGGSDDRRADAAANASPSGIKLVLVNREDADGDGVLDFADGFNADGVLGTADDVSPGAGLTPVALRVAGLTQERRASGTITFDYSAASPQALAISSRPIEGPDDEVTAVTEYSPGPGLLRIWRSGGGTTRVPSDFVEPNLAYAIDDLLGAGAEEVVLYVEAVNGSAIPAEIFADFSTTPAAGCLAPAGARVLPLDPLTGIDSSLDQHGIEGYELIRGTGGTIDGTDGNDIIIGSNEGDFINGHDGDDIILPGAGGDWIVTGDGRDLVFSWRGSKDIVLNPATDRVSYMAGHVLGSGYLGNHQIANAQGEVPQPTPEPGPPDYTAPSAPFTAAQVRAAYIWSFGELDPFLRAFSNEGDVIPGLMPGELHVVPSFSDWRPSWLTSGTWDFDRIRLSGSGAPVVNKYVCKIEYDAETNAFDAAVALRQAILSEMRFRDFDAFFQSLIPIGQSGVRDPTEFDVVYQGWDEMRNAQKQHVISITKALTEVYISTWLSAAGPAGEVIDALVNIRETAQDIAAAAKAGFSLVAVLPGKLGIRPPARDQEGPFLEDLLREGGPPEDPPGDDDDPPGIAPPRLWGQISLPARVLGHFAESSDVFKCRSLAGHYSDIGFVVRRGMDVTPFIRADGSIGPLIAGTAQRVTLPGGGFTPHHTTIETMVAELAQLGRLQHLPTMPERNYMYIGQNRSVRTMVADAEHGTRLSGDRKRPDIIAVWRDDQGNIGVDMFEVASGPQDTLDLETILDEILEQVQIDANIVGGTRKAYSNYPP